MSTTSLRRTQFAVAKQHGRVRTLSAGSAAVVLDNTIVTHNGIAGAHTTTGGGAIFTRQDNRSSSTIPTYGALTPPAAK